MAQKNCEVRILLTSKGLSNKNLGTISTEFILHLENWFSPMEYKDKIQQMLIDVFSAFDESGQFPDISKDVDNSVEPTETENDKENKS
jgi:hypothetical protein